MAQHVTIKNQSVSVGDTIAVHQQIKEGAKTRVQIFEGLLIGVQNRQENKTFTIRKLATNGIGVEKIFPVELPSIEKIVVRRKGDVRRAKLNYLRDKVGKRASRVKEKVHSAPQTTA